jgi:type II secretory pathway pseudopilin PulG
MELVIAVAMITIIFAAIVPQFVIMRGSWDSKQGAAEAIQNGRVLMDHVSRNLSKAKQITSAGTSSIDFNDCNGVTWRYNIGANNYVQFGQPGNLSDLAGPVSSLTFTCYDACDLNTPITDVNHIRIVKTDAIIVNPISAANNKSFETWAYLRTNSNFGNWCAYNDCVYNPGLVGYGTDPFGNSVHYGDTNRITVYGIGTIAADHQSPPGVGYSASSGQLKNYATGASTGVTATLTQSGGVVWQPIVGCVSGTCWSGGYDTAVCTDAYNTFHGIVDMTGIVYYGSAGWWVDVTFTGLNPSKTYTFATSASRAKSTTDGAPGYTNRWTIYTISGVDAATNASTPGTTEVSNPYSVRFNTGNNHFEGYVARWTGIRPGTDGSFKVRATADPNSESGYKAYAFSVFELQSADEITQIAYPISYRDFNEAKAGTDTTSLAISTPPSTSVGDLLIAAVATDGSTSLTTPAGWTLIDYGNTAGQVTLGAWWKIAGASESSPTFTWTGGQQAYGWMMRFTGQNAANPINASYMDGQNSISPISPEVTTSVGCSLILRLGAFDDDDVNTLPEPGNPGLSGHAAITMDESAASSAAVPVAILGSWVTGLTHAKESGNNRALIFIAHEESTTGDPVLTSVTYGGQAMTRVIERSAVLSGYGNYVAAFILNESGVNAASSSTFTPTWSGTTSSVSYASVFLSNVDQTTSIGASDSNGTTGSTPNPIKTNALATNNGDMVIVGATCGNNGSYTLNNGFTEGTDQSVGTNGHTGVTGRKSATGANETPSATHTAVNRQVIIGFVVKGIAGVTGTVSGGAGYVQQSAIGSSGTSTFTLGSSKDAMMITIAIAPANASGYDCCGELRP